MSIDAVDKYNILPCKFKVVDDDCRFKCFDAAEKAHAFMKKGLSGFDSLWYSALDRLAPYNKYCNDRRKEAIAMFATPIASSYYSITTPCDIQELVNNSYTVITANVDNIQDAEVICLGENHFLPNHQLMNARIIDALKGEIIALVEAENGDDVSEHFETKYVKKKIDSKGWDIHSPKSIEGRDTMHAYKEAPQIPLLALLVGCFCLGSLMITLNSMSKIMLLKSSILSLVIGFLINHLIKITYNAKHENGFQKIVDEVPRRNRNMCKTIQENSQPGRKVVVIGGLSHFVPSSFLKSQCSDFAKNFTPYDTAFDETIEFLQKRKFAILVPS